MGKPEQPSHSITDCNQPGNLNLILPAGNIIAVLKLNLLKVLAVQKI